MEALAPGAAAGLTIVDEGRSHKQQALFPSFPREFSQALTDVPLQPSSFGSCVKAIATGETITCSDVLNDRSFDERWRKVCRAVQSRPVHVGGKAQGTFVIAYRNPRPKISGRLH